MNSYKICFCVSFIAFHFITPVLAQESLTGRQPVQYFNSTSSQDPSTEVYHPSVPRLGLQFGSGVLMGVAGGLIGGLGGAAIAPKEEGTAGLALLGYAATGAYIGYSAVSALGVYMAANSKSYKASFGKILLGHGIGATAGIGAIVISGSADGAIEPAIVFSLAAPVIGGIIANKKTIRKQKEPTALINISENHKALTIPPVHLTEVGNYSLPKQAAAEIKLLNISF